MTSFRPLWQTTDTFYAMIVMIGNINVIVRTGRHVPRWLELIVFVAKTTKRVNFSRCSKNRNIVTF